MQKPHESSDANLVKIKASEDFGILTSEKLALTLPEIKINNNSGLLGPDPRSIQINKQILEKD
jgi:hypothetical protein